MLLTELLWAALLPAVTASIIVWLARRARMPPRAAWPAAVGLAYIAGHVGLAVRASKTRAFWSTVRPNEVHDWLPTIVLLAMGVSLLAAYVPAKWQRWVIALAALLTIAVPVRLLSGSALVLIQWSLAEKLAHLALLPAALALVWLLLSTADESDQPRLRALLLILVAAATAIVLTRTGSFSLGRLAGVVTASLAGAALAAFVPANLGATDSARAGPTGAAGVITVALGSLVLIAHFYAELPATSAALLAVSLVAAAGRLPEFATRGPAWQQAVTRSICCLVPLALAVVSSLA